MGRRSLLLSWILVVFLVPFVAAAAREKNDPPKEDQYELFKMFVDAMDQVERNYVKKVDRRELIEAAIQGMLTKLDPYSNYIGPDELERFRASVENEFGGIGVQVSTEEGSLKVISPLVGTPAYRAGIMAGDVITEIEGESTEGISIDKATEKLKGPKGTKVTITVLHPGATDSEKKTLTREVIHVETVLGDHRLPNDQWDFMLRPDERIAYVRLVAFSRDTARDLRKVLKQLRTAKLRGLILDLRFNPGGLLSSAIEVSDLFLSKGRIVSTAGRNSLERTWDAQADDDDFDVPMVILINQFSASASEIVAACLQDNQRATVVGERSWGKGSVQNVTELGEGASLLKLTTSKYLRPSGKNIDRLSAAKGSDEWGVRPDKDCEVKLDEEEMGSMVKDRRARDVLQSHKADASGEKATAGKTKPVTAKPAGEKAGGDRKQNPVKPAAKESGKSTAEARSAAAKAKPFVDRQLNKAIDCLTAKLARADKE